MFHNITPKEYLPISCHELIDKSFAQMSNLAFADHVCCVSQTNRDVLEQAGINVPSTVLPLAVNCSTGAPILKPSFNDGISRILFIGRLVRSKGPNDLLKSIDHVLGELPEIRINIDLVGNLNFSDATVVRETKPPNVRIDVAPEI